VCHRGSQVPYEHIAIPQRARVGMRILPIPLLVPLCPQREEQMGSLVMLSMAGLEQNPQTTSLKTRSGE